MHVGSILSDSASPLPPRKPAGRPVAMLDKAHHAVEVPPVDHSGPPVAGQRVAAVIPVEAGAELRDELIDHVLVNEQVVGRDAGLPAVYALSPGDALSRPAHMRALIDDAGALPSQLEHHRRQLVRRGSHHRTTHGRASREEHEVPPLVEQPFVHARRAGKCADVPRRKRLAEQLDEQLACRARGSGGFDGDAVARRDGVDERHERKLERVVPRTQHENHAVWRGKHFRAGREMGDGSRNAARTRPRFHVLAAKADLLVHQAELGGVRFERALSEILAQCAKDPVLVALQRRLQTHERLPSRLDGQRRPCREVTAHMLHLRRHRSTIR